MTDTSVMCRCRWRFLLALLVAAAAGCLALRGWLGPDVVVETAAPRDFVQSAVTSGRVEAPNRVDLGAQTTGTVSRTPVAEGQAVTAGERLIELESAEWIDSIGLTA